jgi:hypothetical protein
MKKGKYFLIAAILLIAGIFYVKAAGSASASVSGSSTVKVGDEISYGVVISDLNGLDTGATGIQGVVNFDTSYFTLISTTPMTSPLSVQDNKTGEGQYNLAGFSLGNGFNTTSTVYTLKLKAIKEGSTSIKLSEFYLSDLAANLIKCNTTNKTITIQSASDPVKTKSSDSSLSNLSVDGYSLSPSFNASTKKYTITVPADTKSINVNATSNSTAANINGTGSINLSSDTSSIPIIVTAEDGSKTTYTITVNKESSPDPTPDPVPNKSSDATLKSLDVSGYSLSPSFDKDKTTYSMKVNSNINGLNVSAIPTDSNANVEITGNSNWHDGENSISIKVTAEDGTTKTYLVNVNKAAASSNIASAFKNKDNSLKELTITNGDIDPKFDANVTDYSITIPADVEKLDITAIPTSSKSTIEISGNEDFQVGQVKSVLITVTAEDGSKRIYTVNVTKSSIKSNNKLNDIIITNGGLEPEFDPNNFDYNVNIDDDISQLDITALAANDNAKVEIIGNNNLDKGSNNKVLVKVTDENGFTQYYKLSIKRDESNKVSIFGLKIPKWLLFLICLGTGLLILFLFLFFKNKKKKDPEDDNQPQPVIPNIEIKPEFNFGSKNGTDDDVIEPGGVNNQYSGNSSSNSLPSADRDNVKILDADVTDVKEIPYDPYDEIVTKDELYDAIAEAKKTNDASMLNMLLAQEKVNREKEKIKKEREDSSSDKE